MNTDFVIFYVIVVYSSLAVGVLLKFVNAGVKGGWLLFPVIAPLLMLTVTPVAAFKRAFIETKGTFFEKFKTGFRLVIIAYKFFPVLVGAMAKKISSEQSARKAKKLVYVINVVKPYYSGLYDLGRGAVRMKASY